MAKYHVSPLSFAQALLLVLTDKRPRTDAIFIHGSPAESDLIDTALLGLGADMQEGGQTGRVVINGLTDEQCIIDGKRLAYPGSDTWGRTLARFGIEPLKIPASKHTAAESDNVIALAREMGWKSITIASYPHHVLRCFAQMVFCLERAGETNLQVYSRTVRSVDWQMPAKKGVLGGGTIEGILLDHVEAERTRLEIYADRDAAVVDGVRKFTPHATLEQLMRYIVWRDAGQVGSPPWQNEGW